MKKLAIILAAGRGRRMGLETPKQYLMLLGKPMFMHSLLAFDVSSVDEIALVVAKGEEEYVENVLRQYKIQTPVRIVAGGAERYISVYHALDSFRTDSIEIVSIHDSARPAIRPVTIEKSIQDAMAYQASVVAVQSKDTVKMADGRGFVKFTPDREEVYIIQTPQSFHFLTLLLAYDRLMDDAKVQKGVTDDAMVVERMLGMKPKITLGEYSNIKVTTSEDIALMERFMIE